MRRLAFLACALLTFGVEARTQPAADLPVILAALATRTQQYYDRFISIICTETVHTQDLRLSLAPAGRPRTTVYELSVSRSESGAAAGDFHVERTLQSVNGRQARKNQKPECTDPKTGTPEPLEFLLAANQRRYRFTDADAGGEGAGTRALDFIETPPERVRIKWDDTCFQADGGGQQGRIWFNSATHDIVRVDVRLSKPFVVPMPNRFFGVLPAIRVERSETTIRFTPVAFEQPDEALMLPASIETLNVLRGAPSIRMRQTLTNYRRFLTKSEIRIGGL